jgi:transcriptional regulator with XRE-family HTH domain
MKTFAERLAGLRQEAGLSQKVVAGLVNATAQAILSLKESDIGKAVTWVLERVK